jgi:hypothetical protein
MEKTESILNDGHLIVLSESIRLEGDLKKLLQIENHVDILS